MQARLGPLTAVFSGFSATGFPLTGLAEFTGARKFRTAAHLDCRLVPVTDDVIDSAEVWQSPEAGLDLTRAVNTVTLILHYNDSTPTTAQQKENIYAHRAFLKHSNHWVVKTVSLKHTSYELEEHYTTEIKENTNHQTTMISTKQQQKSPNV